MKRTHQFRLFYFAVITCSTFVTHSLNSSTTTFSCLPHQTSVLLQFKQEFTIKRPEFVVLLSMYPCSPVFSKYMKTTNWKAGSDCCLWDGVSCNMAAGHVVGLDLSCGWLNGPLRSNSSLFSLLHLQHLNLCYNNFAGSPIPSALGKLSRLTDLDLSHSKFSGHIPSEISMLTNLMSLDLSCEMHDLYVREGELGRLIKNMTNLRLLKLDGVNLSSSPVPPQFMANFSFLTDLSLVACDLHGEFPKNIFQLPKLQFIDLSSNNNLTGSLPEFNSSSNLNSLFISSTSFSGKLPDSIGNLRSLNDLDLKESSFSGAVPSTSFGNLTQLTHLDISNNCFHGKFPNPVIFPNRIEYIDFGYNNFTGPIPSNNLNLSFLFHLGLSNNLFTGVIPSFLFAMPSLRSLYLDHNQFIDLEISNSSQLDSNSSQLDTLFLSGNKINGQIPSSISKFKELRELRLDSNNFSGSVDFGIFSELSNLQILYLSFNGRLSVANTSMDSTIIPQFHELYLSSCNLSVFPDFLKAQDELEYLDLSNNRIGGPIPNWFFSISIETLRHLNLSHNFIGGWEDAQLLSFPWKTIYILDLRSNKFQGPLVVPPMSTWVFLISNNILVGGIDPLFCELKNLQVLDASKNHLNGTIP